MRDLTTLTDEQLIAEYNRKFRTRNDLSKLSDSELIAEYERKFGNQALAMPDTRDEGGFLSELPKTIARNVLGGGELFTRAIRHGEQKPATWGEAVEGSVFRSPLERQKERGETLSSLGEAFLSPEMQGIFAGKAGQYITQKIGNLMKHVGSKEQQVAEQRLKETPHTGSITGKITSPIIEKLEEWQKAPSIAAPDDLGYTQQAIGSVTQSLTARAPLAAIGAVTGGPLGAFRSALLGGGALYGLAQYDKILEQGRKLRPDLSESELKSIAMEAGLIEGTAETVLDIAAGKFLNLLGVGLKAPLKETIKETLKGSFREIPKQVVKNYAKLLPIELAEETVQSWGEHRALRQLGVEVDESIFAHAPVTAISTLIFAGIGTGGQRHKANKVIRALENPKTPIEQRMQAVEAVGDMINMSNPDIAVGWTINATGRVLDKKSINTKENLSNYNVNESVREQISAWEQGLAEQERVRQSPESAEALRQDLAGQEAYGLTIEGLREQEALIEQQTRGRDIGEEYSEVSPIVGSLKQEAKSSESLPIPPEAPEAPPQAPKDKAPQIKTQGGTHNVKVQRGGVENVMEAKGKWVGDYFVARDVGSLAYTPTIPTYGLYDREGNPIKGSGGHGKQSGAIDYAKGLIKKQAEAQKADTKAPAQQQASLIEEAKKYKTAEEFINAEFDKKPAYGMSHRPTYEGMPPAHNLLEGDAIPRDVYEHPEWSVASQGLKDISARESWDAVKKIRNNPEAEVIVYRATRKNQLNIGDWITFSKNYARDSVEPNSGEKVYSFKIKAKDAFFAGDDINEFGYYPKSQLTYIWNKAHEAKADTTLEPEFKETPQPPPNQETPPNEYLHAGVPIDGNVLRKFRDNIVKTFPRLERILGVPSDVTDVRAKDITFFGEILRAPKDIARVFGGRYPELNRMWHATRNRFANTNAESGKLEHLFGKINKESLADVEDAMRVYKMSSNMNAKHPDYNELSEEGQYIFNMLNMITSNINRDFMNSQKQRIVEYINNTPTITDKATKEFYIKAVNNLDADAIKHGTIKSWVKLLQTMGGEYKYYSPQSRTKNFMVYVLDKDGKSEFAKDFNTQTEAAEYRKRLDNALAQGNDSVLQEWFTEAGIQMTPEFQEGIRNYTVTTDVAPITKMPYEAMEGVDLSKALNFLNETVNAMKEKGQVSADALSEAQANVIDKMMELHLSKGWSKHRLKRENTPGYELDSRLVMEQMQNYAKGYYASKYKGEAINEFNKAFRQLASRNDLPPQLVVYMKQYADYVFGTPESAAINKTAHFISIFNLAANAMSPVVNASQNIIFGNAVLLKHGLRPMNPKAIVDVHTGNLTFSEKKAIVSSLQKGFLSDGVLKEMVGRTKTWQEIKREIQISREDKNLDAVSKAFGSVVDTAMLPFRHVEVYVNRMPMFVDIYRQATKQGKSHKEATQMAEDLMLEAHFEVTRHNRPAFMRGAMRIPTALHSFNYHAIHTMFRYMHEAGVKTPEARKALLATSWMFGSIMALGGAASIPLMGAAFGAWKWTIEPLYELLAASFGYPERDINEDIKQLPSGLKDMVEGGLLQLIGMSGLSSRLGFGISPEEPTRNIVGYNMLMRASQAYDMYQAGQYDRALVRAMPPAFRYIGEAAMLKKYGLTTVSGTPILDEYGEKIMPTTGEVWMKRVGLESNRIKEVRDAERMALDVQTKREQAMAKFRNRLISARTMDDEMRVFDDIDDYNGRLDDALMAHSDNPAATARLEMQYISPRDIFRSLQAKERGRLAKRGKVYVGEIAEDEDD